MESSFIEQVSTWGRVFEIAVQRGVLAQLTHRKLLLADHPILQAWKTTKVFHLQQQLLEALDITDPNAKERTSSMLRHTFVLGYGLGWTAVRECLKRSPIRKPKLAAIWCPLTSLKQQERGIEIEATARAFHSAFDLPGEVNPNLLKRGQPARADLILWFSSSEPQKSYKNVNIKCENFILCFEFSYNSPIKLVDFTLEQAHREEIARYARYIESRGVFSKLCTEIDGDQFTISSNIAQHLAAFSSKDKPLFKLCQAASYTERLVHLLESCGKLQNCKARAIAVTSNGLESLGANFAQPNEPRVKLMKQLGKAYRDTYKLEEDEPERLNEEIRVVFNNLVKSLPKTLKQQAKQIIQNPEDNLHFLLQEEIVDFYNPTSELERSTVLAAIEDSPELNQFFSDTPQTKFIQALSSVNQQNNISLREVHQAAVIAGLDSAQRGRLNVIALEGNPGIGKTTAVTQYLKEQRQRAMLFYVSPRVIINGDVTAKLSRIGEKPSGILTVTTNSNLIAAIPHWYQQQIRSHPRIHSHNIDSAVVVDGIENLVHPDGNIYFLSPEQEQQINENFAISNLIKKSLNERQDSVESRRRPGVLRTLATAVRQLLDANRQINQVVLTAATQGYRTFNQKSTIDALDKLFAKKADTEQGREERTAFSHRIPTVIVMIDELAGDGAGAPFAHKLATWLTQQFIEPFANAGIQSPFKVVLIVSDASLSNEVIFNNYLNSGDRAPNKVLISPSKGQAPFRVAGTLTKIGPNKHPTLHVMTNSYPASRLKIDYSIRLTPIVPTVASDGSKQSIRQAIREQWGEHLLANAYSEIKRGLEKDAKQIIFFAQDKAFLRDLKIELTSGNRPLVTAERVAILDQNVQPRDRLELIQPPGRDRIKVFLMTSSGARGVSFPLADWIIASIPRFNIETALMEVAQLIYRGRGTYTDSGTGVELSGDLNDKQLVMLVNDFVVREELSESLSLEEKQLQARLWLRQASDLLTLLVMLRSTIHTRIKGDAGLRRHQIAFVPVGLVGEQEFSTSMSESIGNFLRESIVFVREEQPDAAKALVKKAEQLIRETFVDFSLIGQSMNSSDCRSYTERRTLEVLTQAISRSSTSLLVDVTNEDVVIPESVTCIGPFWLEDWSDRRTQEQFTHESWRSDIRSQISQLLGLLMQIGESNNISPKLKRPANELHKLLIRSKDEIVREYSTLQVLQTQDINISLPLDYPHFWHEQSDDEIHQQILEDPITWHSALGRTLTPQGLVMPVLAQYQSFPWAAVVSRRLLQELESVFSDRYFMVSNELNLLNTILLED